MNKSPSINHKHYMRCALLEAVKAFEREEVPVGSVIVHKGRIIARAHNQRETLLDPTAHAEMIAITQAAAYLENWRLSGATLYVTLEPCLMCMGAILEARIDTLVFGTHDNKGAGETSILNLIQQTGHNHKLQVISNILEDDCKAVLQGFFHDKRINPRKKSQESSLI